MKMHKTIEFSRHSEDDIRSMAIFLAQLEKEGVAYRIGQTMDKFKIEITGH
jgi:hypothetical protein